MLLRMKPPPNANTPLLLTVTYKDRVGQVATSRWGSLSKHIKFCRLSFTV